MKAALCLVLSSRRSMLPNKNLLCRGLNTKAKITCQFLLAVMYGVVWHLVCFSPRYICAYKLHNIFLPFKPT